MIGFKDKKGLQRKEDDEIIFSKIISTPCSLVHNCTIFLCHVDVGNIDDQCRCPGIKEKDHLAG